VSSDYAQILWTAGTLRCLLITTPPPREYSVTVFTGDSPVVNQRCANPAEADEIAECLRAMLVDRR
jgi:hypothetical protein